jgi:hypothetical protein
MKKASKEPVNGGERLQQFLNLSASKYWKLVIVKEPPRVAGCLEQDFVLLPSQRS